MFDLTRRVALVTGAGRSVGLGIVEALVGRGAAVAVNDVDAALAGEVVGRVRSAGGTAVAAPFDVTDPAEVDSGVAAVVAELGDVDVLVNNAGNAGTAEFALGPVVDLDPRDAHRFVAVNLNGVLNCTTAVLPAMYERGNGRVITISSVAALRGTRLGVSLYGASKGAATAFMRHLAIESARHGVTANTLALGLMGSGVGEETASVARSIPAGRAGRPSDVAAAVVWLASDEAAWVTGTTIPIDGGSSAA